MSPQTVAELFALDTLVDDEERAIIDTVRDFGARRLRPHVAQWFEDGSLPVRDLATELGELGLFGMHLEGYGCAGTSATAYGLACLELEAVDSGLRSFVSVQGSLSMFAIRAFGSDEQREEWLPRMAAGQAIGCFGLTEPDFGSNPAGMRTSAKRDGDDWVLNGTKMWITNGSVADVAVVWARTDLDEGARGIRGFVVPTDTPGFRGIEIEHKMSLRASVTAELVLEDVRLPASAMLPGVEGLKGPLSCLNEARFGIVFGAVGAARDCLEAAVAYATDREVFDKSLAGYQITQVKLADMALEVGKAQLLALHLGRRKDAGGIRPEQISLGKLNNVREAIAIARECRTILGANGITLEYPVIRHANNLESVLTYEGTSEMHQLMIGKALTGKDAFR
ncbi:acyl-CoA dehydrogenase domain protein [Gordonia bronchialis DSM 43247]|uniref:Acyl-CoA dehydrogenase domain protein n=1 Tax=Gordonia bronchialis (strain ATCC 25592 / DSM 43247 / BCRC 13721 / JCM 3198 / KCTC 3076 / NBRC 16047 / NCTC 10667) TaxID=526226 RepID=D0L662_GORB4|nr:acyl-CoA dehydrogenase family protein [Gordonia bronchialis]ACY23548.1 acyl-CoA dehydrogenase domain protein [Gordonia bronchialis DSM 43247]MCC3321713.1 acyl-CoA dehydrogenase family protein [Gordonia bronchialis]QGS23101.1 acyl-CoA dehydrogenase [Gordonia bronchialis]UAK36606.1 acyl-CoA dehydrogenase family protein [Gordonia bronchialis]STQ66550.1 Acyl-CoA dehydrogenase, short-chain specific [Gordonia bronchialis]